MFRLVVWNLPQGDNWKNYNLKRTYAKVIQSVALPVHSSLILFKYCWGEISYTCKEIFTKSTLKSIFSYVVDVKNMMQESASH